MPEDVDRVTRGERLHSFDAIRAAALLLGVVLHASESFIPDHRAWAIVDDSTSSLASLMVYVILIFRLPAFFLLAGFFGRMALHRRGPADFIRDRAKCILVPFVLGWCLLYPLIVCAWIWGAQRSGGRFLRGGAREPAWQVTFAAFATGDVFRDGVQPAHHWFLYYLLMYYAAVLTVRQGLVVPLDRAMGLRARSDRAFAAVWRTRWYFVLLALPVFGSLCLAPGWVGVDTPAQTLRPNPPYLVAHATFFAGGWLLHRQPHLVDALARKHRSCLGWAVLLTALAIVMLGQAREPSDVWVRIPYVAAYALAMWVWVLGLVGLGVRYVSRSSRGALLVGIVLLALPRAPATRAVSAGIRSPPTLALEPQARHGLGRRDVAPVGELPLLRALHRRGPGLEWAEARTRREKAQAEALAARS